jgi:sporulation protein YlmC with PRC-barrel domain
MAQGEGSNLVKLDDFEGELDEHWQEIRGRKVIDKNGDEVGTVEELYIWEGPSTVHLITVSGEERSFLMPEFDSDDVPDSETRRAAFDYYGYPDPLDLGGSQGS